MTARCQNALFCRIGFVTLAVTLIAGHGGEGDQREPRPGRSGCHQGPRSTSRSDPRVPLWVPGDLEQSLAEEEHHPGILRGTELPVDSQAQHVAVKAVTAVQVAGPHEDP